jgi:hypothetical protein
MREERLAMGLLKDNSLVRGQVKGILSSIITNLDNIDSKLALELSKWLLKKSDYMKRHCNKEKFPALPKDMKRGDIVWVEFGINIGDEFSDQYKDGHYAMIWSQQGFVFTVFPLTSDDKYFNDCAVNIGNIPDLPHEGDTYLKVDMIRSIHIRRIRKLKQIEIGKISIDDESILNRINDKIIGKLTINNKVIELKKCVDI